MTANALAWLNDLMQWLGRWVPRLVLIHATHRGVLFGPKGGAKVAGPGIVFYWPITHDLVECPVTMQSIQLNAAAMPVGLLPHEVDEAGFEKRRSLFPHTAFVTLNVQFSITDPVKAATKVLYFHALVSNKASSVAMRHWMKSGRNIHDLNWLDAAREELAKELAEYGIRIDALEVGGIGKGVAIKQFSDWSWNEERTGTRPKD